MPTYEYVCKSCGHAWEAEQRISENPLTECPSCHQQAAQRQISGGNFILKGGGWYSDLYSSAKPNKTESTSTTSEKSETKSESKSETKAEPAKTESTKPPATSEKK